jgi:hypothetical protein
MEVIIEYDIDEFAKKPTSRAAGGQATALRRTKPRSTGVDARRRRISISSQES